MTNGYNQNFLDALTLVSFMIGVANYDENLSQSDKDDMMQKLDKRTNKMLARLEEDLEYQNQILDKQTELLEKILERLEE